LTFFPSYLRLLESGELDRRVEALRARLAACDICPHLCGNDRMAGERARCYAAALPIVSAATPHFGEEPGLVGTRGVGNIFFGNCNLRCVYCQNHLISQNWREEERHTITVDRLAGIMLELQEEGCHLCGLVSPTHFVPQIVEAVAIAARRGFALPLVYNTNAYDAVDVLALLEGVVDVYLPDLKYAEEEFGYSYSRVREYPRHARAAITEMHRQVGGDLVVGEDGVVRRGLIIRHLVLPNDLAGSREALRWIAAELGTGITVSVMAQYYPTHRAVSTPLLDRKVGRGEYERVLREMDRLGLHNGWIQEFEAAEYYRPEFEDRAQPFKGGAENRA
jgi:putative pyruvate formate lyase activating enzyme